MTRLVAIDCFPAALERYSTDWAVVAVDVIRATTTVVTAAWAGWQCFPVATLDDATARAAQLTDPLLAGELGGVMPYGFDLTNSPAAISARTDLYRPLVLLSTSGTKLMAHAAAFAGCYAACLRNVGATVAHVVRAHDKVAVVGAGSRGEFRHEDQLGCARVATGLIEAGFRPIGDTADIVAAWRGAPVEAIEFGHSANYLRTTGQLDDLQFVLDHEEDVDAAFALRDGELTALGAAVRPAIRDELAPVREALP